TLESSPHFRVQNADVVGTRVAQPAGMPAPTTRGWLLSTVLYGLVACAGGGTGGGTTDSKGVPDGGASEGAPDGAADASNSAASAACRSNAECALGLQCTTPDWPRFYCPPRPVASDCRSDADCIDGGADRICLADSDAPGALATVLSGAGGGKLGC